jgi:hypothetical protein
MGRSAFKMFYGARTLWCVRERQEGTFITFNGPCDGRASAEIPCVRNWFRQVITKANDFQIDGTKFLEYTHPLQI